PVLTNPSPAVVPPAQPCTATDVSNGICLAEDIDKSAKGLCKAGLDTTDRISVTTAKGGAKQPAAVIFVSHGQTGYGSYVAAPTRTGFLQPFDSNYLACPNAEGNASKGFAQCNSAERNSRYFYDAPASVSSIDSYDDLLAYADRNALVAMLGNGACQSTW
ncbi:MAG: hypothetical protein PHE27_07215, partial [Alphaproteobacteria bacterium]|nr:hypothetical protein [Alphaproteobacteria bacterium]